ncbi:MULTISPECIES: glutamate--cysteine ligase [unclassified Ectothiorhodospira]|uniref:glutamate--cysteine ligase n=1 Tax=unclassified Ectothiorhodospira TaxID=2684909 RepID=UPI0021020579|nr:MULTISPECIES: glutamate--cysteine ligase [unclassified Ectothiorhodospira]
MPVGQEIDNTRFTPRDTERFRKRVAEETRLAREMAARGDFGSGHPMAGFEIEAWLVNADESPASLNERFLARFDDPMATPELASFNVELNTQAHPLRHRVLTTLHQEIRTTWERACDTAESLDAHFLMIGILPTLMPQDLCLKNMSAMKRYRALNRQVFRSREDRPVHLDINGREHLEHDHKDVMLEAATTSFQIHLQTPLEAAHRVYNAAIAVSAPMVALSANAPYLFGKDLWEETRIPVFEQAVEVGGYQDAARGPMRRVSFGSDYARESIMECFQENLDHFPPLLPMCGDTPPETFAHLRLHNGTIWRWNRPLIGFGPSGRPHIRIEHRVVPAGPTLTDSIANAAFFYGLVEDLVSTAGGAEGLIDFATAKDNFYLAARHGLESQLHWDSKERISARELILQDLLPRARRGLQHLGVTQADAHHYLEVVAERVQARATGSHWQRAWVKTHGPDMAGLTRAYRLQQMTDEPIHQWPLP